MDRSRPIRKISIIRYFAEDVNRKKDEYLRENRRFGLPEIVIIMSAKLLKLKEIKNVLTMVFSFSCLAVHIYYDLC